MARAQDEMGRGPRQGRRSREATPSRTVITSVEPNRILLRGYPLDELMGRVSFAEAVYLLLTGELPTPAIGKLMDALLVSSIDHGTLPPSTLAARNVATTGAPLRASVAAGVLAFGKYHGGDIDAAMRLLEGAVAHVREGLAQDAAAQKVIAECQGRNELVPGFGHRLHSHDPRAVRLFQMALELDLDGPSLHMCRAIERALNANLGPGDPRIPINVDGAIAAICCDIGLPPELGQALFIVSRVPGLIAQAYEEQTRERPMRLMAGGSIYEGPAERRLPQTRK
jgi:citrate synthase